MRVVTWPTVHAHYISLVGPYTYTVKDARQGVERPLKAGALGRRDKAVIGIEERQNFLD